MRLSRGWLVAAWIALLAIYGLHLIAQAQTLDEDRQSLPAPEVMVLHGNAFWLLACMAALGRPRTIDLISTFGFTLAGFYGALAFAARHWHRDAAVHLAGLAGALAAIAFAIELRGPALVVALAAEGVVLVWLGLRAQRGLLRWGGLALLAVATLLACAALSEPAPTGAWLVFNGRTLSCVFTAAALIAAAWLFGRLAPDVAFSRPPIAVLIVAASVLGLFIVSAEINAFYAARVWQTADPRSVGAATSAELARQLTLSMTWAAYALALVAAGLRWSYRPVRYLAIALFALTAAKVGLVDLARLERVYRMLSVMGLGILLLVASYLYQRLRRLPGPRDGAGVTT
jgi:hypothetical protein